MAHEDKFKIEINKMQNIFCILFLLFINCTVILPGLQNTILKSFNNNDLQNKYHLITDSTNLSEIVIKDSIAYFFINSACLYSNYERKVDTFNIYDTLIPITSNVCKSYLWNPNEGKKVLYDCEKWENGIIAFRGKYINVMVKNKDTLTCEIIERFNAQIQLLLFVK